jgi:prophage tail gpP-like protein
MASAPAARPEIKLKVNGREYAGWKTARVTRSIESVAGSFELGISERWSHDADPWPILEEDECSLSIGSEVLITGYVDKRAPSFDATQHGLSISGRDKTGDLVDCSAVLTKWEYLNVSVLSFCKKVAEPFGISVTLQPGIIPSTSPKKLSIDPGDSAFEAIEKACRIAGLLPVSDGQGGLLLTRAGRARASTALVQGENILAASGEYDATGRFYTYKVLGQHKGTDEFSGEPAATVRGSATDLNVRRTSRVLLVRPEGNVTTEQAKQRAAWEATVRAARSGAVSVTVQGWTQGNGALWPINTVVPVRSKMIGVDGDMLICAATYNISDSGSTTQLTLKSPGAFKPEPTVAKSNDYWKEIVHGV